MIEIFLKHKKLLTTLVLVGLFVAIVPHFASAQITDAVVAPGVEPVSTAINAIAGIFGFVKNTLLSAIVDIGGRAIGKVLTLITYAINYVLGVFVAFEAYFINFLLNI